MAVATVAGFAALRLQDWVDPVVALIVAALAFVLWGAVRGQLRRRGALVVEMAGMIGFTAIALAAVSVGPDTSAVTSWRPVGLATPPGTSRISGPTRSYHDRSRSGAPSSMSFAQSASSSCPCRSRGSRRYLVRGWLPVP